MNRTSLCIKMLLLLKARGKMNTQQLAAELETNPRNIREFKKELITAGYNIKEYKGRYGGYRLDETNLFPVLALTSSQKQALIEAREFMHAQGYENEADLIEWIESQDSVKEYLLSLVRKDIEKSKKKEKKKKTSKK